MSWLAKTVDSSIGGKLIVALTGLGMVGFVVAHLTGNLLVFAGPEAIAAYAEGLRHFPKILWTFRIALLAMTAAHIVLATRLNLRSRAARPVPYAKKGYQRANFASRSMLLTGLLTLAYILFHLAHFTFRVTSPEIASLGPYDVYHMVLLAFSAPLVSITYIVAMIVLGIHLSHGLSSLFQTLGWNHPKYNGIIRGIGPVLGTLLAAGFISIPVAVMLGILK